MRDRIEFDMDRLGPSGKDLYPATTEALSLSVVFVLGQGVTCLTSGQRSMMKRRAPCLHAWQLATRLAFPTFECPPSVSERLLSSI